MASILTLDNLQNLLGQNIMANGIFNHSMPQIQQTYLSNMLSQVISVNVITPITNLNVTITPKSTNSKILIIAQWNGEWGMADAWNVVFGLQRNGINIGMPVNPQSLQVKGMTVSMTSYPLQAGDFNSTPETASFAFLDTPASVLPQTYSMTAANFYNGGTLYTNRTVGTTNQTNYELTTSHIIALELA